MNNRIFVFLPYILTGLLGIFFLFNAFIYRQKQGDTGDIVPYTATLTGTETCLPPAPGRQQITLECAFGFKTDAGEYYAADFTGLPGGNPNFTADKRFRAAGEITPVELLSTDHWRKYDVRGIFRITDIREI